MKKLFKTITAIALLIAIAVTILNFLVIIPSTEKILTEQEALKSAENKPFDCILVLGCSVHGDGTPSKMLRDRLEKGIELYKSGVCDKLLLSGDHRDGYSETNVMKQYALDKGVAEEDIIIDEKVYSTIESAERMKNEFGISRALIVTQNYHLYRAIFDSEKLGIDAYGVASAGEDYSGQIVRDIREVVARAKDYIENIETAVN